MCKQIARCCGCGPTEEEENKEGGLGAKRECGARREKERRAKGEEHAYRQMEEGNGYG